MWWYYKFDSPKSLGVCYWCVKIPQHGYMEHGLKHILFYVLKHIVALPMCYNPALVCDKPQGAPASVKLVYSDKWKLGYLRTPSHDFISRPILRVHLRSLRCKKLLFSPPPPPPPPTRQLYVKNMLWKNTPVKYVVVDNIPRVSPWDKYKVRQQPDFPGHV